MYHQARRDGTAGSAGRVSGGHLVVQIHCSDSELRGTGMAMCAESVSHGGAVNALTVLQSESGRRHTGEKTPESGRSE